ncbi:MAG: Pyridoxamine 5'-phosphate oxidase [Chloroflexi bacterium ADurb.Bin325]|nr:MAG: Pyridoxamine 5'-phosphate oxidase [Chloroflexi bacterium ADurb.Bin325]
MRRTDKEITDPALIDWVIRQAVVCRLGLSQGGRAYIVPLSFGYDGRCIYFHTAAEGRKLEMLAANPHVCFELEHDVHVIPHETRACAWSMSFYSVMGTGVVHEITAPDEKVAALQAIVGHYSPRTWDISAADTQTVRVWRLEIAEMTGKKSKDKAAAADD